MNHTNLEMIYGNQAKPEIAKEETDNQTIRKEDAVSTHIKGDALLGGLTSPCPNCKLAYKNGYNAALRWVLKRLDGENGTNDRES